MQRLVEVETVSFEEENSEQSLRPSNWDDYIGQEKIKKNLRVFIDASRKRAEALDHILFYGPPGLGKTTLSYLISNEMSSNIKITAGPMIEKSGDLAAILTNLEEGDILFIDEIQPPMLGLFLGSCPTRKYIGAITISTFMPSEAAMSLTSSGWAITATLPLAIRNSLSL